MAPLKVYGLPASSNADRAKLLLSLAGVDYESVPVNLSGGEHKAASFSKGPEYRVRSPWGKIPAVALPDGTNICESRAIVRYIAAKYLPSVLPPAGDLLALARYEEAASAEQSYFDRPASQLSFELYIKPYLGLPIDNKVVEETRAAVKEHFEVLDKILAKRKYVAGDTLSFVDINYLPQMRRLVLIGEWGLVEARPHVEAWWKRCLENERLKKYLDTMPTLEALKEHKKEMDAKEAASKS